MFQSVGSESTTLDLHKHKSMLLVTSKKNKNAIPSCHLNVLYMSRLQGFECSVFARECKQQSLTPTYSHILHPFTHDTLRMYLSTDSLCPPYYINSNSPLTIVFMCVCVFAVCVFVCVRMVNRACAVAEQHHQYDYAASFLHNDQP